MVHEGQDGEKQHAGEAGKASGSRGTQRARETPGSEVPVLDEGGESGRTAAVVTHALSLTAALAVVVHVLHVKHRLKEKEEKKKIEEKSKRKKKGGGGG